MYIFWGPPCTMHGLRTKGMLTAHELNWTDLQQVDPVTRRVHWPRARQRLDFTGCGRTRTVGAQSVRALWTRLFEYPCSELNWSSVPFSSSCAVVKKPEFILAIKCNYKVQCYLTSRQSNVDVSREAARTPRCSATLNSAAVWTLL